MVVSSRPATASSASRVASKSSRRRFIFHSQVFSGSIARHSGRSSLGLLIHGREHDLAVQPLERPAVLHEVPGQVIEQRRVRGRLAAQAEVAGRAPPAPAEVIQPHAIDDHARRQRIVRGRRSPGPAPAGRCRVRTAPAGRRHSTRKNRRGTASPKLIRDCRARRRAARPASGRSSSAIARGGAAGPLARQSSMALSSLLRMSCDGPIGQQRQLVESIAARCWPARRGRKHLPQRFEVRVGKRRWRRLPGRLGLVAVRAARA